MGLLLAISACGSHTELVVPTAVAAQPPTNAEETERSLLPEPVWKEERVQDCEISFFDVDVKGEHAVAVGRGNCAAHLLGGRWVARPIPEDAYYVVRLTTGGKAWAAGESGSLAHYNGSQWSAVSSPTRSTVRLMELASGLRPIIGDEGGRAYEWEGGTWKEVPCSLVQPFTRSRIDHGVVSMIGPGRDGCVRSSSGSWRFAAIFPGRIPDSSQGWHDSLGQWWHVRASGGVAAERCLMLEGPTPYLAVGGDESSLVVAVGRRGAVATAHYSALARCNQDDGPPWVEEVF